jgi:ComF family protein
MVRAAALFEEPLRGAIHRLKYENSPELGEVLARYLVAAFARPEWRALPAPIDAVAPIPLHRQRLAERGYNQSALLAAGLARASGLPVFPEWLERHRETRAQVGLNAEERRLNVADAFRANPAVAGKRLLLVDDVFTTGATMAACAHAALAAGASAVYGLALAVPPRARSGGTIGPERP